ncbi:MAG: bifunctional nuclease family protein [Bacteroidales bacterium]|nr:bifunctional nuclease family protein [Bacteroidales bacterium]
MDKIRLEIAGMSYSQSQSGAYALILGEAGGKRRLPIIIGGFEAQAIAIELENMKPSRPLTHDLFRNFAEHYEINIQEVIINKFQEGVFYALLVCEKDGEVTEIDSRTSDAIALALRFGCPVYTFESIMEAASITVEEDEDLVPEEDEATEDDESVDESGLDAYSDAELLEMLQTAVNNEDYEKASLVRDEINRRKGKRSGN